MRFEAWTLPTSATFEKKFDINPLAGTSGVRALSEYSDETLILPSVSDLIDEIVTDTAGSWIRVYDGSLVVDEFRADRVAIPEQRPSVRQISGPQRNGLVEGIAIYPKDWPLDKEGAQDWKWGYEDILPDLSLGALGSIREEWEVWHDHTSGAWTASVDGDSNPIDWDASAGEVEGLSETLSPPGSGLQGLTTVDDVTVDGAGTQNDPYVIVFYAPPDPSTVSFTVGTLAGGTTFSATQTVAGAVDPSPITISKPVDVGAGSEEDYGSYGNPAIQVVTTPLDTGASWTLQVNAEARYAGSQIILNVTPGQTYTNITVPVRPTISGTYTLVLRDVFENKIKNTTPRDVSLTAGSYQDLTIDEVTIPAGVNQIVMRVAVTDANPANIGTFYTSWETATFFEGDPAATFTQIVRELLDAAHDRGTATFLELDATDAADSLGTALSEISFAVFFGGNAHMGHVLNDGRKSGYEWDIVPAADARVITPTGSHVLQIFKVTNGEIEDLTASAGGPSITVGGKVESAETVRRIPPFTTILAHGAGALTREDTDATAEANMGRVERVFDAEPLGTDATLSAFNTARFAEEAANRKAASAVVLESDSSRPLVDYQPGSKIWWNFGENLPKEARIVRRVAWTYGTETRYEVQGSSRLTPEAAMAKAVDYLLNQPVRRRGTGEGLKASDIAALTQKGGVPTVLIAASDASPLTKAIAWKVADGSDDVAVWKAAEAILPDTGGRIVHDGTWRFDGDVNITKDYVHVQGLGYSSILLAAADNVTFFNVTGKFFQLTDFRAFGDDNPDDITGEPPITYGYTNNTLVNFDITLTQESRTGCYIARAHIDRFGGGPITTSSTSKDRWLKIEDIIFWRNNGTNGVIDLTGAEGDGIEITQCVFRHNSVRPVSANANYTGIVTDNDFIGNAGTGPNVVGANLDVYHNRSENSVGVTHTADFEHDLAAASTEVSTSTVVTTAAPHIGAPNQAAWYSAAVGRTYIAYLGLERDLYITYYDHQDGTFATPVEIDTNPIADDDDHGTPTICVAPTGTIHIVHGSHGTVHRYVRSNNPHDFSAFTAANLDASVGTYPQIACDPASGNLYIVDRTGINTDHDTTFPSHGFAGIRKSTDDGVTWSAQTELVNSTGFAESVEDFYPLGGLQFGPDGFLHLFWTVARGTTHDDVRTNVYHAKMDPTDDNWYAADGTALGTAISTAEHTDCLVVSRNPIGQFGAHISDDGHIIVMYSAGTIDMYASVWDGTSWTETDVGVDNPRAEESFPAVWEVGGAWRAVVPVDAGSFSDLRLFGSELAGTGWTELGTLFTGASGEGFTRGLQVGGDRGPAVALTIEENSGFTSTSATANDLVGLYLIVDPARHSHLSASGSSGTDEDAIHDNVAGEIAALTEVTPVSGDWVLIEDASDSNNKKKANASNFLSGGSGNAAVAGTTLTDDDCAVLGAWEDWGTEVITITDPGAAVTVIATATGSILHGPSSRRLGFVRVGISFDGGSTYTFGPEVRAELDSTDMDSAAICGQCFKAGTPTGDIKIKAQLFQTDTGSNTAGDLDFIRGSITAAMA